MFSLMLLTLVMLYSLEYADIFRFTFFTASSQHKNNSLDILQLRGTSLRFKNLFRSRCVTDRVDSFYTCSFVLFRRRLLVLWRRFYHVSRSLIAHFSSFSSFVWCKFVMISSVLSRSLLHVHSVLKNPLIFNLCWAKEETISTMRCRFYARARPAFKFIQSSSRHLNPIRLGKDEIKKGLLIKFG